MTSIPLHFCVSPLIYSFYNSVGHRVIDWYICVLVPPAPFDSLLVTRVKNSVHGFMRSIVDSSLSWITIWYIFLLKYLIDDGVKWAYFGILSTYTESRCCVLCEIRLFLWWSMEGKYEMAKG